MYGSKFEWAWNGLKWIWVETSDWLERSFGIQPVQLRTNDRGVDDGGRSGSANDKGVQEPDQQLPQRLAFFSSTLTDDLVGVLLPRHARANPAWPIVVHTLLTQSHTRRSSIPLASGAAVQVSKPRSPDPCTVRIPERGDRSTPHGSNGSPRTTGIRQPRSAGQAILVRLSKAASSTMRSALPGSATHAHSRTSSQPSGPGIFADLLSRRACPRCKPRAHQAVQPAADLAGQAGRHLERHHRHR